MIKPTDCPKGFLAFCEEAPTRVKNTTVPDDFDFNQPYHQALAELRHNATNYEEILEEVGVFCMGCEYNDGQCPLIKQPMRDGDFAEDCNAWTETQARTYELIKHEATSWARGIHYQETHNK